MRGCRIHSDGSHHGSGGARPSSINVRDWQQGSHRLIDDTISPYGRVNGSTVALTSMNFDESGSTSCTMSPGLIAHTDPVRSLCRSPDDGGGRRVLRIARRAAARGSGRVSATSAAYQWPWEAATSARPARAGGTGRWPTEDSHEDPHHS